MTSFRHINDISIHRYIVNGDGVARVPGDRDATSGRLETSAVAVFVTAQAVVTVHKDSRFAIEDVMRRWDDAADLASHDVGVLLHGLLDHVVDSHFDAVSELDAEIEALQDLLFAGWPARPGSAPALLRAAQEPGAPAAGTAADA